MNILIINGPNLNLLGLREPEIYGNKTYQELENYLITKAKELDCKLTIKQTNYEGKIIDLIHSTHFADYNGLIINPAALTHYSYAIRDALVTLTIPCVEVHLSNIKNREHFRKISVIEDVVTKSFSGEGFISYSKALNFLIELIGEKNGK